ncbi:hypothetical protein BDD43_5441 [Mucilaginibacter gracilis]|uniref:Uncharacterized protein n=1 Tax=Mucilaginibacter gracilis TaxID=423350 RepID=A0A495J863_9SPHI|nr:hypothetical protein [Mucilaginibacter gracilis]RKR85180.1 hypothetical protein BDD43_5441 [Mucilaginibacter gracilis]
MKKLIFIGFCAISFAAQAHGVKPVTIEKKPELKKVESATAFEDCIVTVEKSGIVDFTCMYTGTETIVTISTSCTVTSSATETPCSDAFNRANQCATAAMGKATQEKMTQLQNSCIAP